MAVVHLVAIVLQFLSSVNAQQATNNSGTITSPSTPTVPSTFTALTTTAPPFGGGELGIIQELFSGFNSTDTRLFQFCVASLFSAFESSSQETTATTTGTFTETFVTSSSTNVIATTFTSTQLQGFQSMIEPPCCSSCTVQANNVRLIYWPTPAPQGSNGSTTVNSNGFTFTSPSIYLAFSSISAFDLCSTDSPIFEQTVAIPPNALFTSVGGRMDTTALMNFEDLNGCSTLSIASTDFSDSFRCSPLIVLPSQVTTLNPAFASCVPQLGGLEDPPSALTPVPSLGPPSSSAASAAPSTTPPVPTPPPTQTPQRVPSPQPPSTQNSQSAVPSPQPPSTQNSQPVAPSPQPPSTQNSQPVVPSPQPPSTQNSQPVVPSPQPPPEQSTVDPGSSPASKSTATSGTPAPPVPPQSPLETDPGAKAEPAPTAVSGGVASSQSAINPTVPNGAPVSETPAIGTQGGSTTAAGLAPSVESSDPAQPSTGSVVPPAPISGSSGLGTPVPSVVSIANDGPRTVHVPFYTQLLISAAIFFFY